MLPCAVEVCVEPSGSARVHVNVPFSWSVTHCLKRAALSVVVWLNCWLPHEKTCCTELAANWFHSPSRSQAAADPSNTFTPCEMGPRGVEGPPSLGNSGDVNPRSRLAPISATVGKMTCVHFPPLR